MIKSNSNSLNYIEQKILVKLSLLSKKSNGGDINIYNKDLAKEFGVTDVYIGLILGGLEKKNYISRSGRRGVCRSISILNPQYKIM